MSTCHLYCKGHQTVLELKLLMCQTESCCVFPPDTGSYITGLNLLYLHLEDLQTPVTQSSFRTGRKDIVIPVDKRIKFKYLTTIVTATD